MPVTQMPATFEHTRNDFRQLRAIDPACAAQPFRVGTTPFTKGSSVIIHCAPGCAMLRAIHAKRVLCHPCLARGVRRRCGVEQKRGITRAFNDRLPQGNFLLHRQQQCTVFSQRQLLPGALQKRAVRQNIRTGPHRFAAVRLRSVVLVFKKEREPPVRGNECGPIGERIAVAMHEPGCCG